MKWNLLSFRRDIYGGLTAAVVAITLALAFRVASAPGYMAESSGAISGAIFVGFFSALPGVTPSQICGPTRPMTMVMASLKPQSRSRCVGYWCESGCR
ncbi:MAG: hypothetical protein VB856_04365 [Rhodospirillales bacterium]